MKLNKYKSVEERLREINIKELSDIGLKFLASDIRLEHSGKEIDSNIAVQKLYEISNELYRRLRQ